MEACSSGARTGSGKRLCGVGLLSVVMMGSWLLVRGLVQLRGMDRGGVLLRSLLSPESWVVL